jgi:hypothetical protein
MGLYTGIFYILVIIFEMLVVIFLNDN